MIENRHLRYFIEVARTLHMTRAAQQLHIAQPALTQNMQQLEEELGTLLIHRDGRKLSLTEAGEVLLVEAERSLQQFELAKTAAQRAGRGEVGRIAIGFGSTAGVQVVPRMVKNFCVRYPDVQVDLKEMGNDAQIAALRSGEIDVAVAYVLSNNEFQSRELSPESLVVVLPSDHPSASQASIEIKELSQDSLILPLKSIAAPIRDAVLAECSKAGFSPKLQHEIATIQTALGLVAMGLGVSVLPASIKYLSREGVVILPIRNSAIEVPLQLLWKRDYVSPVVRNLLETI